MGERGGADDKVHRNATGQLLTPSKITAWRLRKRQVDRMVGGKRRAKQTEQVVPECG